MSLVTIRQLTADPAREIVEGRAPKKFLRTVPAREFSCEPFKPETVAIEPPSAAVIEKFQILAGPWLAEPVKTTGERRGRFPALMEKFYAQHAGGFTAADVESFAASVNFEGNIRASVSAEQRGGFIKATGEQAAIGSKHLVKIYERVVKEAT